METDVLDVATKRAWPVWNMKRGNWFAAVTWLGDDQLLTCEQEPGAPMVQSLWVMNRDGTSKRKVLP